MSKPVKMGFTEDGNYFVYGLCQKCLPVADHLINDIGMAVIINKPAPVGTSGSLLIKAKNPNPNKNHIKK